jgi:hypothetical protein
MNVWGFHPDLLGSLQREFVAFLQAHGGAPDTEFYLPRFVGAAIAAGSLQVRVLSGGETWFGITNPEDAGAARRTVQDLIRAGAYPECLWR